MKRLIQTSFIFSIFFQVQAQDMEVFNRYNRELHTHNRNGMIALGSWGVGNIIVGTAGALTTEKGSMIFSFHLMNASWNVVNLGIALPAYFGARKRLNKQYDIPGTFKLQRQQETLYAINMAADVLYVGSGVFLQELKQRGFVLHYVIDNIQTEDNLDEMLTFVPAVFQSAGLLVTGPQVMALELMQRIDNRPRDIAAIPQYRDEGHRVADMLITECHQNRRSSVYLNLDLDDGTPAFSFDVALSQCNIPGTIVVVRDQAPAPDSPVGIFAPEGVDLSQIVGG